MGRTGQQKGPKFPKGPRGVPRKPFVVWCPAEAVQCPGLILILHGAGVASILSKALERAGPGGVFPTNVRA
eukprot:3998411-Karenia_brevis.AAC.1